MTVIIYDTTLRDGTQGEGVQMSVTDKLSIAQLLADLGVGYIEGGYPGSNPRDKAFFEQAHSLSLGDARLCAFGSTRRAGMHAERDANLQGLVHSGAPVATIFGKAWRFQATHALRIDPEENLELIEDSVRYLTQHFDEVIFDAEHFFDGFAEDEDYALAALSAAERGGASHLVLCDTNGGALPGAVARATKRAVERCAQPIGIHTHNDAELAVANALRAVEAGARMVQGTINGTGERCGNANLVSIIPALSLKMGIECLPRERLEQLTTLSHTIDELSNRRPVDSQPYVGRSAFAHKGGMHVDAVRKDPRTYEHIDPARVGNQRRILVSDLSGRANLELKAAEYGIDLDPGDPHTREILERLKTLESRGYQFEGAEASFKLLVDEARGQRPRYFGLRHVDVNVLVDDKKDEDAPGGKTVANIEVEVGGVIARTSASGDGPVHAMDVGLRGLIDKFYPTLKSVRLVDYKVRVLSSGDGTQSVVRVLIQSSDGDETWGTVGVSPNIISASWRAMVDALEYKLVKDGIEPHAEAPHSVRSIANTDARSRRRRKRSKRKARRSSAAKRRERNPR